jgi:glutamate synthase (ferredoxin)
MEQLCRKASVAVEAGVGVLILSDRGVDAHHAPIPSLLAVAGVHHHLVREGTRHKCGLLIRNRRSARKCITSRCCSDTARAR